VIHVVTDGERVGASGPTEGHTMSSDDNVKTVQSVYEAFGRGDVSAILEVLTDDVDWASDARLN